MKDFYTIAGRRILIETQDDWSAQAVSSAFANSFLTPIAPDENLSSDGAITIRFGTAPPKKPVGVFHFDVPEGGVCHTDGEMVYFDFDGSAIVFGSREPRKVDVWLTKHYEHGSGVLAQIIAQAFSAALRRCDVYEFHSAAVVPPGYDKAVLIAGPSGSGKSTLTLQLAARGWNYLSDDTVLLHADEHGLEAYALRKLFGLRSHTISALQLSHLAPTVTAREVKTRVSPENLFPSGQITRARPGAIVFPIITQEMTTQILRVSSADAMTRLLRLCPWAGYDKPTATKHLRLLAQLAGDCIGFDLLAGTDVLEKSGSVAELLLANLTIG